MLLCVGIVSETFEIFLMTLQIQELENRRKVLALLEMVGQTDQELVRMLDNQDRVEAGIVTLEGDFVPQRIRRYIEKIRASTPFFKMCVIHF